MKLFKTRKRRAIGRSLSRRYRYASFEDESIAQILEEEKIINEARSNTDVKYHRNEIKTLETVLKRYYKLRKQYRLEGEASRNKKGKQ